MTKKLLILLTLLPAAALAQPTKFLLSFKGSCWETNSDGRLVLRQMTEKAWAADYARAAGVSPSSVAVVYAIKGSEMGDTIQVVDVSNGNVLGNPIGFFFGQDFGRQALHTANGLQTRRLDYIYTSQNSHSLGSALISGRWFVSNGQTNRTVFSGRMQWLVTAEGANSLKVCSGNFVTKKPFVPAQK